MCTLNRLVDSLDCVRLRLLNRVDGLAVDQLYYGVDLCRDRLNDYRHHRSEGLSFFHFDDGDLYNRRSVGWVFFFCSEHKGK